MEKIHGENSTLEKGTKILSKNSINTPNNPDPFRGNPTSFRKTFIFTHSIHFMTQRTRYDDFEVKKVCAHIPLHPRTGFNPQQGRHEYSEITVSNSVSLGSTISDTLSSADTEMEPLVWWTFWTW